MRYGVWWLETVIAHYGHAEPIGGKWCVDRDGHPWTGDNEDAEQKAERMRRAHPTNSYEARLIGS